jgi:hypothetical protein
LKPKVDRSHHLPFPDATSFLAFMSGDSFALDDSSGGDGTMAHTSAFHTSGLIAAEASGHP